MPGLLNEILSARQRGVPAVGVSGIVGGKALRGPADRMLVSLGEESSALGVARRYAAAGLLDVFVIDKKDEALSANIRDLGLEVVITQTVMTDLPMRASLARQMLVAAAGGGAPAPSGRRVGPTQ